jgi:selenocysteine-specific elongation factor
VPLPAEGSVEALTTRAKWTHWLEALIEALRAHHRDHPLLPGMEMELLRTQLAAKKTPGSLFEVAPKLFRAIVDRLARERRLVRDDSIVRLPEHRVRLEGETRSATEGLERALEKAAYTPPEVRQLAAELKLPPARVNELLQTLARDGRAAKVANDLYYHASVLERLREMIAERIRTQGPLGAADFRDMIGATRKYSIPLLEYFDRTGFTIRVGDQRKLRKG